MPTYKNVGGVAPQFMGPEQAASHQRLGRMLIDNGMSDQPMRHWTQALGSVLQTGVGALNQDMAMRDVKEGQAAGNKALAQMLMGGDASAAMANPYVADKAMSYREKMADRGYAAGKEARDVATKKTLAGEAGLKPGTPEFMEYVYGIKRPDPNADLDRRYKEAQIEAITKRADGGGVPRLPVGHAWVDPANPSAGVKRLPGYEQTIPGEVAGKVAMMADAKQRIANTRKTFERQWSSGDMAKWAAGNVPLLGDIAALSGDIGIAQRDVRTAIEAALRTMTGAAAPEQEVVRYMQMYMPGPKDTTESAKQKLDGLVSFMDKAEKIVMQGRGEVPGITSPLGAETPELPVDEILSEARTAIEGGAPRDAVIQRLIENGIDPGGL